jgi:hypothetical protein
MGLCRHTLRFVVFVPIRAVGDVRMLLLVFDSVAALDSSRVDIVRVKSVGSLVLGVIDDGCSFYELMVPLSVESTQRGEAGFCLFARFAFQIFAGSRNFALCDDLTHKK